MNSTRLTEKNMANKLFKKNEQAILLAYYKFKDYPTAKRIAHHAKISRSTLHRHHKTPYNIPHDYEEYLFRIYIRKMKSHLKKDQSNLQNLFLRFLVFIFSNREIIQALFRDGHKDFIKRMLGPLKPRILADWRLSGNLDKIYTIYENEILGVIENWGKHHFANQDLSGVLNDIMFLTKTARQKLLPLI